MPRKLAKSIISNNSRPPRPLGGRPLETIVWTSAAIVIILLCLATIPACSNLLPAGAARDAVEATGQAARDTAKDAPWQVQLLLYGLSFLLTGYPLGRGIAWYIDHKNNQKPPPNVNAPS